MDTQMLALILIFVFAVIALLGLGARSFTQLVALILEAISKVEAAKQEIQQGQITLFREMVNSGKSAPRANTPITQEEAASRLIENTETTK